MSYMYTYLFVHIHTVMSPAACNSWGIHNRCGAALDTAAATDKHGNASMLVCRLMRRFMQGLCRAYAALDVGLTKY